MRSETAVCAGANGGVLCLAYPQVRKHLIDRYRRLLQLGDFDGLFVCLRSQSKPAAFADQFGYNEPVRRDVLSRYGVDIRQDDIDRKQWRKLLGEYLTCFLIELRSAIRYENVSLGVVLRVAIFWARLRETAASSGVNGFKMR